MEQLVISNKKIKTWKCILKKYWRFSLIFEHGGKFFEFSIIMNVFIVILSEF